ncbi:cystatin [Kryptolebias marmoratus]|uniref:Cystatin-like n=1 Tax=Kryptolebias marmoratus TaxID=37003 RepID=A0A3Q3ATZ5_KRYMA|nr:cystatin [Kryptolebias marmoratus]
MWKIVLALLAAVYAVAYAIPGGISDIDSNDESVQMALNFSVAQHNNNNNATYLHKVTQLIKAQYQVVSGMLYHLTVNLASTTCKKDSINEKCDIQTAPELAQTFQCNFTVWHQAWMNNTQLTKHECLETSKSA